MRKQLTIELGNLEVEGISRRDLFRKAFGQKIIADFEMWSRFHVARNETSHNYDETNAERVYVVALEFAKEARHLIDELKARGWQDDTAGA